MKLKWIGLVAVSFLIMVGCEESSGNEKLTDEYVKSAFDELNEEHAIKLPENVKNGTVSEDTYTETIRYITDFQQFEKNMFGFQDRLNKDSSLWYDDSFLKGYKESIDSYDVFIKGFHLSPNTKADIEISTNLSDTLIYTSYIISALRQYVNTEEVRHVSSIEEDVSKRSTSYTALTNSIKKFELYTED